MTSAEALGLQPNSVFAGRYRIIGLLGEGDRKRTYLAADAVVPRRVALAVVKPTARLTDLVGTRREAEVLARAGTHDNLVTFHDYGTAEDVEYLVFGYLPGGTLREQLGKLRERGKKMAIEDVMKLGRQLARALSHVHKRGLIHRDVAPGNVWLDERQVAHLGDFDSAVTREQAKNAADVPPTTEAYAAPEQVAGLPFDERTDLYSLGAVLYEALTGERPQRGTSAAAAKTLNELRPDLPRNLRDTVCRLLEESANDRPQSAEDVLDALKSPRAIRTAGERLLAWSETLPFPLASILWHYDGEPEPDLKLDYLMKFFEGLAQFTATVLLSACASDPEFLATNRSPWFGGGRHPLNLQLTTFGTWTEITARLAPCLCELLGFEDGANRCRELFASADVELAEALTSPQLTAILRHACDRRNNWSGHGGVASHHVQRERLADIENLLDRVRAVLGWSFETWTLVKPGPMTCRRGIFDMTATILKGPHPSFRRKHIQLAQVLDAGRLYLLSDGNLYALELLPFFRVLADAAGQDACYFYSRMQGTQARWVSYHFHAEPELTLPDDELADLLARLTAPSVAAADLRDTDIRPRLKAAGPSTRSKTVWSLLEECVGELDEPFGRSEIVDWFRRHHPDVKESTLAAHIQAATSNAKNRAQNNQLGKRPPLVHRIDRGRYMRARG